MHHNPLTLEGAFRHVHIATPDSQPNNLCNITSPLFAQPIDRIWNRWNTGYVPRNYSKWREVTSYRRWLTTHNCLHTSTRDVHCVTPFVPPPLDFCSTGRWNMIGNFDNMSHSIQLFFKPALKPILVNFVVPVSNEHIGVTSFVKWHF